MLGVTIQIKCKQKYINSTPDVSLCSNTDNNADAQIYAGKEFQH